MRLIQMCIYAQLNIKKKMISLASYKKETHTRNCLMNCFVCFFSAEFSVFLLQPNYDLQIKTKILSTKCQS